MKICVAQTRPAKGDIPRNIAGHKTLIDLAASKGAETIIFPELSVTGYEPALAGKLATTPNDHRFDDFQQIADKRQITIGVGVPTRNSAGVSISIVLFQPHKSRQTYSKQYIHTDEEEFFVRGPRTSGLIENTNIALAICYELSISEHAQRAAQNGAGIYIASAVKTPKQLAGTMQRLAEIAVKHSMTLFMANCVGQCDCQPCGGRSSIWNNKGQLIGQLNDTEEGVLMLDTETQELVSEYAPDQSASPASGA